MNSNLISLFCPQVKVNCQVERNLFFSFHGSYTVFRKGKPTVFGTAFDREPEFKTENLIKYRIQCRHYGGACVCEGGYNITLCHPILGDSKFVV